ncbi:MAG: rRNA maturation RNase YbeY [Elusimicrobia bacterium]|nr:rRNA maturation RNase YbeY [Elusimicrobiota bacterium]
MGREGLTVRVAGLSALPPSARRPGLYEAAVRRAFALERSRRRGEVSVVFLTRARMRAMNREFLGHDWDTDVISFEHEAPPGVRAADLPLGDVCVSAWMARRQAAELGHPVLREALTLVAHGTLHLLGHDDAAPRAKARMFRRQDEILEGLPR